MREIGLFIWVGILILGVVSSIAKSAKRQQQGAQQAPGPATTPLVPPGSSPQQATLMRVMQAIAAQQGVPPAPPRPVRPASKPAPPPPPPPSPRRPEPARHAAQPPATATRQRLLFGSQRDLVRAVIAAEVLGKPKAFNDEYPR
jgi:hypothetical protein